MRNLTVILASAALVSVVFAQSRSERDAVSSTSASAPLVGPPPAPSQFCAQPFSSSNCMPVLDAIGTQSLTAGDPLELTVVNCPSNRIGAMIWNTYAVSLPFASGTLCIPRGVGAQLIAPAYTGSTAVGGCTGMLSTVLTAQQLMNNGAFAGSTVYAQFVFRSPRAIGSRLVMSHAISADIAP